MHPQRARLAAARRVVIKVGTAVVTRPDGGIALGRMGHLVERIAELRGQGREVLLVSSGAVGLGAERLGFAGRPSEVVDRQACAAAGQGALLALYDAMFRRVGLGCAQVLLTEADFHDRRRYLNLASTLQRLLGLGAVPVINENDVVSTEEIALSAGRVFGDNDRLSALVAGGLGADLLVLLTDVDGVYTAPPGSEGAERIGVFEGERQVSLGAGSPGGRGGMGAKIEAARVAARSGCAVVVATGRDPLAIANLLAGDDVGTLFPPRAGLSRWRHWLGFATAPAGRLVVNAGARQAMEVRHASLLLPGVVAVEGAFAAGAVVEIVDEEGFVFARGVCARSSEAVREVIGGPPPGRGRALVHRDQVVLLCEPAASTAGGESDAGAA